MWTLKEFLMESENFSSQTRKLKKRYKTLDDLFDAMKSGKLDDYDWSDLPTYGGKRPKNTEEIWSWDKDRVIVGTHSGDITIEDRKDLGV